MCVCFHFAVKAPLADISCHHVNVSTQQFNLVPAILRKIEHTATTVACAQLWQWPAVVFFMGQAMPWLTN